MKPAHARCGKPEKANYIELRAEQILVRHKGAKTDTGSGTRGLTRSEAQAQAEAAALYQKLQSGADFETVAKASSDDDSTRKRGGEMPAFTRGAMVAEFEKAAFALPAGGVSAPFKSAYGWHIVKVVERRPFAFDRLRPTLEFARAQRRFEAIASADIQLSESYFKP